MAREGGAKSEEGGARANLSSKESHILKKEPSLVKAQRALLRRQEVCKCGEASAQFSHVLAVTLAKIISRGEVGVRTSNQTKYFLSMKEEPMIRG